MLTKSKSQLIAEINNGSFDFVGMFVGFWALLFLPDYSDSLFRWKRCRSHLAFYPREREQEQACSSGSATYSSSTGRLLCIYHVNGKEDDPACSLEHGKDVSSQESSLCHLSVSVSVSCAKGNMAATFYWY